MSTGWLPNAGGAGVRVTETWGFDWSWVAELRGDGGGRWQADVGLYSLEELMGKTAALESKVLMCLCGCVCMCVHVSVDIVQIPISGESSDHSPTDIQTNTRKHPDTWHDLGVSSDFLCRGGIPGSENVTQAHQNRDGVYVTERKRSGGSYFTRSVYQHSNGLYHNLTYLSFPFFLSRGQRLSTSNEGYTTRRQNKPTFFGAIAWFTQCKADGRMLKE